MKQQYNRIKGNPTHIPKPLSVQSLNPMPFRIVFQALPRNSDGAIAQLDFSSDDTKIRRL